MQAESAKLPQNKVSQHSLSVISDDTQHENSILLKLLRWLTASVILGKLATKSNDLDPKIGSSLKDLLGSLGHAEATREESSQDRVGHEEFLASTILFLQRFVGTNFKLLPSVVCALSILLLHAFSLAGIPIHLFRNFHDGYIFWAYLAHLPLNISRLAIYLL